VSITLSVVLPCHRGAAVLQRTAEVLVGYLPTVVAAWEVVVVDDGGNDFVRHPLPADPRIRTIVHPVNRGKGAAVRTGMLAATGEVRIFTDVDLPYDRELLPVILEFIHRRGFHMVVGDRSLPGSQYRQATGTRHLVSALGSWFIGSLVTGGFHDTQCGIKGVRGDVAEAIFPLVRTAGFAFDVEVIYLALKHGLDVKRLPVRLRRNASSSVRPLRDGLRAAVDIGAIKWRQLRGGYRSAALEDLPRRDVAAAMADAATAPPPA
jgi:dolichyl-phosphate beta-glucosyltransferase